MTLQPAFIGAILQAPAFGMLARVALTCAYWWGGIAKLLDYPAALAEAQHFGLQPAGLVVVATIAVELGASILLIAGRFAWLAAGALGVFTATATLIAHRFWAIDDPMERFHALNTFLEHIGLIGGLALAAVQVEAERHRRRS
jgi:transmembrane protein